MTKHDPKTLVSLGPAGSRHAESAGVCNRAFVMPSATRVNPQSFPPVFSPTLLSVRSSSRRAKESHPARAFNDGRPGTRPAILATAQGRVTAKRATG